MTLNEYRESVGLPLLGGEVKQRVAIVTDNVDSPVKPSKKDKKSWLHDDSDVKIAEEN